MRVTAVALCVLFAACQQPNPAKTHLPSAAYKKVAVDTAALTERHTVYAPVYSAIHFEDGATDLLLAATLSVRNVSLRDSLYLTAVRYYDSQGQLLKNYLDSAVLLTPLQSVEFVVERSETKGGAGANFLVHWGARTPVRNRPLVQTVMMEGGRGVSFVVDGVETE